MERKGTVSNGKEKWSFFIEGTVTVERHNGHGNVSKMKDLLCIDY